MHLSISLLESKGREDTITKMISEDMKERLYVTNCNGPGSVDWKQPHIVMMEVPVRTKESRELLGRKLRLLLSIHGLNA
jgi:hypothetical protein